jgi:hypothetical protein
MCGEGEDDADDEEQENSEVDEAVVMEVAVLGEQEGI